MNISKRSESIVLFLGDCGVFVISLWFALFLRYGKAPGIELFREHIVPFSFIFALWALVFFIAGLYEKHTSLLKSRIPNLIFNAQLVNSFIAVLFFYLVPYFGITPKTNLFLYLVTFFFLILGWRLSASRFGFRKKENALLIDGSDEMEELRQEINVNPAYEIRFSSTYEVKNDSVDDAPREIIDLVHKEKVGTIVVDFQSRKIAPILPRLYPLIFEGVKFIDMYKLYEDTFDRVPLSLISHNWFLENISRQTHTGYDLLKRLMDIVISIPLLMITAVLYPFILIAVKIEDGGPVFTYQKRIGENNRLVELVKFRTMLFDDEGKWKEKGVINRVTKVGSFLRKTRLDEFPQLWNVLMGDISLIGPRPEFPEAVDEYSEKIPHYNVRHTIKPGLSGWAQIYGQHPHHGISIEDTKNKLSYDLYYIKNRSFMIDLKIALRTITILVSMVGK